MVVPGVGGPLVVPGVAGIIHFPELIQTPSVLIGSVFVDLTQSTLTISELSILPFVREVFNLSVPPFIVNVTIVEPDFISVILISVDLKFPFMRRIIPFLNFLIKSSLVSILAFTVL